MQQLVFMIFYKLPPTTKAVSSGRLGLYHQDSKFCFDSDGFQLRRNRHCGQLLLQVVQLHRYRAFVQAGILFITVDTWNHLLIRARVVVNSRDSLDISVKL